MRWRTFFALAITAVLAFAAVTVVALEGVEAVDLRTTTPDGGQRTTRIWIADDEGVLWIEAANPDRPFLHDIAEHPTVELLRHGAIRKYRAVPVPGEEGHRTVRRLLRERYGWADRWIALLADTSHSVGIRLENRNPGTIPH